jgi:hypothetical protein
MRLATTNVRKVQMAYSTLYDFHVRDALESKASGK